MTFEEDYPRLRGKWVLANNPYQNDKDPSVQYLFTNEEIEKCCLDKSKVREAIEKVAKELEQEGGDIYFRHKLLKELGLQ